MNERKTYAVIGDPILHSRSPLLFYGGFSQKLLPGSYTRLACDDLDDALALAKELGLAGFNVTSPFKQEITDRLDALDEVAARIGAVNTVVARGGRLEGYNTDPQGLLGALETGGFRPKGKRVVVVGAGGAAKAAVFALREAGAARVLLANRTLAKAQAIAERLDCEAAELSALRDELPEAELLVSCLPPHVNTVDPDWLDPDLVVLDANYAASPLSDAARACGCRVISGLAWLLHQAVASFRLFTGKPAAPAELEAGLTKLTAPRDRLGRGIALIGFMGAGKSAVAKALASHLGRRYIDLDAQIEAEAGRPIAEIFRDKGEGAFRRMESEALARLPFAGGDVIACGGGIVLDPNSRRRLRKNAVVIWLSAAVDICVARASDGTRPLLAAAVDGISAAELLAQRSPRYAETADLVVDSGRRTLDAVVKKIVHEIREA